MSHKDVEKVAIIGAGLAGSVAALELERRGISVTLFEGKKIGAGFSQERSEMTLPESIQDLGAQDAITTPLTNVTLLSLDHPDRTFRTGLPLSPQLTGNPLVAIDHHVLLTNLHALLGSQSGIDIRDQSRVESVSDDEFGNGATIKINGTNESYSAVVNAAGPGWSRLPFANPRRQRLYENATVAFAYGHRYQGKLLVPDGDHAVLHPMSVAGSGRTSWVNASGDGTIEVMYSDYVNRKDVGKVNRRQGFDLLKSRLVSEGYIEIEDEGPRISGFFGLEPRRAPSGEVHVFHHGERGQYNSATVGDAIAPTVRLSSDLADIIASDGTAADYERVTGTVFDHRLEHAITQSRISSSEVCRGLAFNSELTALDEEQKLLFLKHHKVPKKYLAKAIVKNPSLLGVVGTIGLEYGKTFLDGSQYK